jgi:phosphoribosylanthranilate isomerase
MTIVKICGITTAEDALAALDASADLVGLNFYPGSPRYLRLKAATLICNALPSSIRQVGVFVDPSENEVMQAVDAFGLSSIQLHGTEPPNLLHTLSARMPVIKAVRTREQAEAAIAAGCEVLLDSISPQLGGSGQRADWTLAAEIAQLTHRFYLAGGLTPTNVAEVIAQVRPYAVDVCSGVEVLPGRKSLEKMQAFVAAAKKGVQHAQQHA